MVLKLAARGARCDYGIYLGASEDNYNKIPAICSDAVALKMYLNETYTTLRLDDVSVWMKVSGFLTLHIYMYVRLSFSFFKEHLLAYNILSYTGLPKSSPHILYSKYPKLEFLFFSCTSQFHLIINSLG